MKDTFLYILIGIAMLNFWSKVRTSDVAGEINNDPDEKRKARMDNYAIAGELSQALANLKKLDVETVTTAVNAASGDQRKAWLKNAAIAAEIARIRAEIAAEILQALANLEKTDVAAMTVVVNKATEEQRKAWSEDAAITTEISRIHAENEAEYDQAFDNLKKINEISAVNLAKKHRREIAEERQRENAAIEAEVARIRAEKAAKLANDCKVHVSPK